MITYQVKGNLFSGDLLEDLATRQGQLANDFDLSAGIRVSDEASRVFSMARTQWINFRQTTERMHPEQSQVTPTRQLWILPLLSFLGYELQFQKAREVVGEHAFYISHRTLNKDQFPVHIIDCRESLDENPDSPGQGTSRGNRDSAHVQMQEYLNHTEHLYGIITNGYKLRLLRDHHRLTGLQYLEWDLEAMMTDSDLASFTMLYRMVHVSRIPRKMGDDSLLELYHQHSVEEGHRVRDKLKSAVFQSLKLLGNGFLRHPANDSLRDAIAYKRVSHIGFGQCLRILVYRFLFLFVAEDRKLVFQPDATPEAQKLYLDCYSLQRFRLLAEAYLSANPRHSDVWEQLKTTFRLYEEAGTGEPLGIAPLGGDLFKPDAMECLQGASIDNRTLLKALDLLSRFDPEKGQRIRINYKRINVEEFGAVYESLLDLNPEIDLQVSGQPFQYIDGESRKGTGSYYTNDDLVKQLLKTALEPVVRERLVEAEQGVRDPEERRKCKEAALLRISVCDPACGSGHFLVAAARALATELAYLRAPRGASIDAYEGAAKRDVIEHCIYGVDVNPDAVGLCRLVLWMESHEAGKPITYLDHKIRCGNSLVGWLGEHQDPVIPDAAFAALPGDDKALVKSCLYVNRMAAKQKGQQEVSFDESEITRRISQEWHARLAGQPVVVLEDYWRKKQAHLHWQDSPEQARKRRVYNFWTYAFFQSYATADAPIVTQRVLNQLSADPEQLSPELVDAVKALAAGENYYGREITKIVMNRVKHQFSNNEQYGEVRLTSRETEVLSLVGKGLTSKEIAEALFISKSTVITHKNNIREKLNLKDSKQMMIFAREHGYTL